MSAFCILLGWIMIQVVMVSDFNLLHFVCSVMGIALIIFGRLLLQGEFGAHTTRSRLFK